MMKRIISITLVLIMILSMTSLTLFTVSAEETTVSVATADEATRDEATVDEPKLVLTDTEGEIEGTVIGRMGDINDDNKINIKDSTSIQKHLAKVICLNEKSKALGDVDNNQKINIRDASTLQKYIAKFDIESVIEYTLYETGTHVHNYVETIVEVRCETDGYTFKSCICGDEFKENIVEAKGHDYNVKEVVPTCVDKGYLLHSCKYCNYSYKDNYTAATGNHIFNSKNMCSVCGFEKDSYDVLKDYLIDKGEYDKNTSSYNVFLYTGYDVDLGIVSYDKSNDRILLGYVLVTDDVVVSSSVIITKDNPYFSTEVFYSDLFSTTSAYTTKKNWTINSDFLANLDCYYYEEWNETPEEECMLYSIILVDSALAVYEYNEDILPVTLEDLGFLNFTAK